MSHDSIKGIVGGEQVFRFTWNVFVWSKTFIEHEFVERPDANCTLATPMVLLSDCKNVLKKLSINSTVDDAESTPRTGK